MLGLAFAILNVCRQLRMRRNNKMYILMMAGICSRGLRWLRVCRSRFRAAAQRLYYGVREFLVVPYQSPVIEVFFIGLITAGVCNLALAASMAEFLSAYPTAGGQYHWVAVISWPEWVPLLSWITGWINVSGWIALTASGGLLGSQFVVGVISLYNPV